MGDWVAPSHTTVSKTPIIANRAFQIHMNDNRIANFIEIALLISAWVLLSSTIILYNQHIIHDLRFPYPCNFFFQKHVVK